MFREGSLYEEFKSGMSDLLNRVETVEEMEGGLDTWAASVNSKLNPLAAADLISRCGTLETKVSSLESGKANISHTHDWSSISGKPTLFSGNYNDLSNKPNKVLPFKVVVSGGNAVFHLTNDGTSSGTALFSGIPNLDSMQLTAEEADSPHTFGTPVLSNSNKTLTVPVKKSGGINVALVGLTLLGAPVAANGSTIRLLIAGAA
jgi:hypothetical protein